MKDDLISRQAAISAIEAHLRTYTEPYVLTEREDAINYGLLVAADVVANRPPAQPDRDIPKKPNETTDRAWGIPKRQAVCPNCDSYLGMVHFISENGKTKITYCESCGQAIDWEGWEDDSHSPEGEEYERSD